MKLKNRSNDKCSSHFFRVFLTGTEWGRDIFSNGNGTGTITVKPSGTVTEEVLNGYGSSHWMLNILTMQRLNKSKPLCVKFELFHAICFALKSPAMIEGPGIDKTLEKKEIDCNSYAAGEQ